MKIEFRRLHHITINAPSGEQKKIRWFYGSLLGLDEVPIPDQLGQLYEIVWFKLFDYLLHIECINNFVKPNENYENGTILPGRHIALEVKNIGEVRKTLKEAQVEIREAVTLLDRDRFYILDPFGNFIEIIEFFIDQIK
jgi:catechol 2,3-dioxygenase-like lactoylglutathione lyase family enzyme